MGYIFGPPVSNYEYVSEGQKPSGSPQKKEVVGGQSARVTFLLTESTDEAICCCLEEGILEISRKPRERKGDCWPSVGRCVEG
jgi:hypothetical protein